MRRCKGCGRFIGRSNVTEYRRIDPAPQRKRDKYAGFSAIVWCACSNCGRRGFRFIETFLDRMIKAVYVPMIVDLLNTETPLWDRFRRA